MILLSTALAAPPAVTAGVTGGYDYPSSQWFGGLEVSVLPRNTTGFTPVARAVGAWGATGHPLFSLEAGGLFVLPNEEAIIRLGAIARPVLLISDAALPFPLGDPRDGAVPGIGLGGQGWLEFEWNEAAPLAVGLKVGVGQIASDYFCEEVDPDFATCRTWHVGALAGFFLRKTFKGGLSFQIEAGTIPTISVRQVLNR
jgi:hypothetical protein